MQINQLMTSYCIIQSCSCTNNKLSLVGMQLPEKYKENFDVSNVKALRRDYRLHTLTQTVQSCTNSLGYVYTRNPHNNNSLLYWEESLGILHNDISILYWIVLAVLSKLLGYY